MPRAKQGIRIMPRAKERIRIMPRAKERDVNTNIEIGITESVSKGGMFNTIPYHVPCNI